MFSNKFHSQAHITFAERMRIKDMPFVVKIIIGGSVDEFTGKIDPYETAMCSGVIISKKNILTAASCLFSCET